jgi:hypothetical protein
MVEEAKVHFSKIHVHVVAEIQHSWTLRFGCPRQIQRLLVEDIAQKIEEWGITKFHRTSFRRVICVSLAESMAYIMRKLSVFGPLKVVSNSKLALSELTARLT